MHTACSKLVFLPDDLQCGLRVSCCKDWKKYVQEAVSKIFVPPNFTSYSQAVNMGRYFNPRHGSCVETERVYLKDRVFWARFNGNQHLSRVIFDNGRTQYISVTVTLNSNDQFNPGYCVTDAVLGFLPLPEIRSWADWAKCQHQDEDVNSARFWCKHAFFCDREAVCDVTFVSFTTILDGIAAASWPNLADLSVVV